MSGSRKPVEEILIAIDENSVSGLSEALAVKAEIHCVPRSGRPGANSERMPEPVRVKDPNVIEIFSGDQREVTVVPADLEVGALDPD